MLELRLANNCTSGVGLASAVSGCVSGAAIYTGMTVIPVIGWGIGLVGLGVIASKVIIN